MEPKLIVGFGAYLFMSSAIRRQIRRQAQGAKVYGISSARLSNIDIIYPESKEEQKKIVQCLSCLDDVIKFQTEKVEALNSHKKGLMQQLFPSDGETIPKLRFPKFENSGAWELKKISQVLLEQARPIVMEDNKDYSLVTVRRRYGGIVSRGIFKGNAIKVKSQFLLNEDDFLISKRQIVHCACGLVPKQLEGSIVSNEYSVLRAVEGNDILFFNYFAQQPKVSQSFLECSRGIVIEKMLFKLNEWMGREFLFPNYAEQRAIASCLSSMDEQINAESQKLNALKIHKSGLIQNLFPTFEEANE